MAVQLVHPGSEAVVEAGRRAIQDSSLYPLLVRPWSVNKVTCGSLLTLVENSDSEVTVSLDACLVILLLINIAIFAPLLLADLNSVLTDVRLSNLFTSVQDRVDRLETGLGLESQLAAYHNLTLLEDLLSVVNNQTFLENSFEAFKNFTGIDKPIRMLEGMRETLETLTDLGTKYQS